MSDNPNPVKRRRAIGAPTPSEPSTHSSDSKAASPSLSPPPPTPHSPAQSSAPQPPVATPAQPPGYYPMRPPKDRGIALVLEILPGLAGLFGIGWIYSGNTSTGVILLAGGIFWFLIIVVAAFITASAACLCTVPLSLVGTAISSVMLNNYTKQHPELFGV